MTPCPCSHTAKATVEITEGKDEKETVVKPTNYTRVNPVWLWDSVMGAFLLRDELDQYHLLFHPREAPFLLLYHVSLKLL